MLLLLLLSLKFKTGRLIMGTRQSLTAMVMSVRMRIVIMTLLLVVVVLLLLLLLLLKRKTGS